MRRLSLVEVVGLAWATMLGFVLITTNRRLVVRPLSVQRVMEQLQAWLGLPHVHIAKPAIRTLPGVVSFGRNASIIATAVVPDAQ